MRFAMNAEVSDVAGERKYTDIVRDYVAWEREYAFYQKVQAWLTRTTGGDDAGLDIDGDELESAWLSESKSRSRLR